MNKTTRKFQFIVAFSVLILSLPASAQPGVFGHPELGQRGYDRFHNSRLDRSTDQREGRVDAAQFAADGAEDILGYGPIRVEVLPQSTPDERGRLTYEAAMLDRLGLAGYDISGSGADAWQVAQIRIIRDVAEPAEEKQSPVSGTGAISVSNRGTAYGLGVSLDFTKPRPALLSTRMELQIVDRDGGQVLWEGRAQIMTRDGDQDWTDDAIAQRLTSALLEGFPHKLR